MLYAMILVAATAIALAVSRALLPEIPGDDGQRIAGAWECLATLSWAILFLRLKQRRPDFRRLMSRPGDAACAASLLATVMTGLVCLVGHINSKLFSGSPIGFFAAP